MLKTFLKGIRLRTIEVTNSSRNRKRLFATRITAMNNSEQETRWSLDDPSTTKAAINQVVLTTIKAFPRLNATTS